LCNPSPKKEEEEKNPDKWEKPSDSEQMRIPFLLQLHAGHHVS